MALSNRQNVSGGLAAWIVVEQSKGDKSLSFHGAQRFHEGARATEADLGIGFQM
jgi:hypothetical protein